LESSNLIIGIDYTKSNMWTGKISRQGVCLHAMAPGGELNPYQHVIHIMGKTLEPFDDDHLIPVYGFGDSTTTGKSVFPFYPDHKPCIGFADVIARYTQITPNITLAGPTSFAPLIRQAIAIVAQAKSYHILVIIADGQVTSEAETAAAIVEASNYPLSIIMVGVGDGPFNTMDEFDDGLPHRVFDNVRPFIHR
jgi:E3 ubiquitin-protein ligase RGLG